MASQIVLNAYNNKLIIALVIALLCWSCSNFGCLAQDDFSDDATADTDGSDATMDQTDTDPGISNPDGTNVASGVDNLPPSYIPGRSIWQNNKDNAYSFDNTTLCVASFRIFKYYNISHFYSNDKPHLYIWEYLLQ